MKTDRFMKVMLVIIALLLALNCANGIRAPFLGNSTEAAVPPRFLQQGKVYRLNSQYGSHHKVVAIEDSGWIKVTLWDKDKNTGNYTYWLNTATVDKIYEQ